MVLCNNRLKQNSQEIIQEFRDVFQKIDKSTECYNTSGDYDFTIKVYTRVIKSYQQSILTTPGKIDYIESFHIIVIIDETKHIHGLPISVL